jgi:hypothetical protein
MAKKIENTLVEEKTAATSRSVRLKNKTKRYLCFNLPCQTVCTPSDCECPTVEQALSEYNARTGEHTHKVVERKISQSVTFLAGETLSLSDKVLKAPDLSAALLRGDLVQIK